MVFLNGTAQSAVNWHPQVKAFKDRFRVMTYDARAQGESDLGDLELDCRRHVADLKEILDGLFFCGLGSASADESADEPPGAPSLVGMSHGAFIALAFAHRYPDRMSKLVLCGLGDRPSRRSRMFIRSWAEILAFGGIEMMARSFLPAVFGESFLRENERNMDGMVKALVRRNRPESLLAHLRAIEAYPPASDFSRKTGVPTLVFSGDEDLLAPTESARRLADDCGGEWERITGVGHSLPSEAPNRFASRTMEFLAAP